MTQPVPYQLFDRASTVTVGTTQIQNIGRQVGMDVWFQVRRSLKAREPNTCELRISNLSDDRRKAIESASSPLPSSASGPGASAKYVPVQIDAGYVGNVTTIFLGEMRSAQTVTDGASTTTELTTGDGDEATLLARSVASFGPGANAYTVAQQLLTDMGVGTGNLSTVAAILKASQLYQTGFVLKGNSYEHLTELALSCGLEVTVQGGVAQFVSQGQPLPGQAYVLSSTSGMIGSPSVDTKGVLSVKTEMLAGIRPGAPIMMQSKYVSGLFRVTSVTTTGDTAGTDWGHDIEAKSYGKAP